MKQNERGIFLKNTVLQKDIYIKNIYIIYTLIDVLLLFLCTLLPLRDLSSDPSLAPHPFYDSWPHPFRYFYQPWFLFALLPAVYYPPLLVSGITTAAPDSWLEFIITCRTEQFSTDTPRTDRKAGSPADVLVAVALVHPAGSPGEHRTAEASGGSQRLAGDWQADGTPGPKE